MPSLRQRQQTQAATRRTAPLGSFGHSERPSIADLPITLTIGAYWMLFPWALRQIQLGPTTASGVLTLLVAVLTLCLLPVYAVSSAGRERLPGTAKLEVTPIPWPMWAFVLVIPVGFATAAMNNASITLDSIQNACVYVSFVGAIAFAAATKSPLLVTRGWDLMTTVSTWFAYVTFVLVALGLVPNPRPMAIVGLIALAVVAPRPPKNYWMMFAPFVLVAGMALSLSRTSTAVGLFLLAFIVLRRQRGSGKPARRISRALLMLVAAATSAYLLVVYYAPFRDRFLAGDNALLIGDVAISTQGRDKFWGLLLSESTNEWLGHGIGAAAQAINEQFPRMNHPHNEYLRFLFDFGIIGASLFVAGYLILMWRVFRRARRTDHPLHWTALMALIGVGIVAITDNPFVYPFVMLPLGSLIGLSYALARFEPSSHGDVTANQKYSMSTRSAETVATSKNISENLPLAAGRTGTNIANRKM